MLFQKTLMVWASHTWNNANLLFSEKLVFQSTRFPVGIFFNLYVFSLEPSSRQVQNFLSVFKPARQKKADCALWFFISQLSHSGSKIEISHSQWRAHFIDPTENDTMRLCYGLAFGLDWKSNLVHCPSSTMVGGSLSVVKGCSALLSGADKQKIF